MHRNKMLAAAAFAVPAVFVVLPVYCEACPTLSSSDELDPRVMLYYHQEQENSKKSYQNFKNSGDNNPKYLQVDIGHVYEDVAISLMPFPPPNGNGNLSAAIMWYRKALAYYGSTTDQCLGYVPMDIARQDVQNNLAAALSEQAQVSTLAARQAIAAVEPPARLPAQDPNGAAHDFWQKLFIKCGDDYYTQAWTDYGKQMAVTEFKGLSFRTELLSISDDDKLNGVEWREEVSIDFRSQRDRHYGTRQWSDWGAGQYVYTVEIVTAEIERRNGHINYYPHWNNNIFQQVRDMPPRPPTCDDVTN